MLGRVDSTPGVAPREEAFFSFFGGGLAAGAAAGSASFFARAGRSLSGFGGFFLATEMASVAAAEEGG